MLALGIFHDASAVDVDELSKCRKVTEVAARAECYDKLVDAAVSRGEKGGPQPAPAQAPFISRPAPAPTQKTVEISKTTRGNSGRLNLLTTENEIWVQSDGEPLPKDPAPGSSMIIRKGSMGGFFCSLDKHTSFRCQIRRN